MQFKKWREKRESIDVLYRDASFSFEIYKGTHLDIWGEILKTDFT